MGSVVFIEEFKVNFRAPLGGFPQPQTSSGGLCSPPNDAESFRLIFVVAYM